MNNSVSTSEQMMTDEFIAEVIQILAIRQLHIDINPWNKLQVKVRLKGLDLQDNEFTITKWGRSIGEALRRIREELREETGK